MSEQTPAKRPKHRSPSYPAINLETAVQRAGQLEILAGRHSAPVGEIVTHWGYSPKSSGGLVALAALKKFGLMEDEGSGDARQGQLSDLARQLLYYSRDRDTEHFRREAQGAALSPKIHRELWERYGPELPNDRVMRHYLVFERSFSPAAADELLKEFRETLVFAGMLGEGATVSSDGGDSTDGSIKEPEADLTTPVIETPEAPPAPKPSDPEKPAERTTRTVQVTYSPTEWALLQASFPMSEDDWDAMIEVLGAMKRGLVTKPKSGDA